MVRLHDIEEILSEYCDDNSYSKCEEVGPSSPVLKPFIYITVSVSISYNFEQECKPSNIIGYDCRNMQKTAY
jgi:hypothetical protein